MINLVMFIQLVFLHSAYSILSFKKEEKEYKNIFQKIIFRLFNLKNIVKLVIIIIYLNMFIHSFEIFQLM